MAYVEAHLAAQEWDLIQRSRLRLNNLVKSLGRRGLSTPPWLETGGEADLPPGLLDVLEEQERASRRAVERAFTGEEWVERVGAFVEETAGLGPAVLCIVALMPPLTGFANPAKVWKYLGLHVLTDQTGLDDQNARVGRAPRRPTCGPLCKKADCIHDRWAFGLKSYAIERVAVPIMKNLSSAYRPLYDQRRAHTDTTHPEWSLERNKAGKSTPDIHSHRDALRYVAKRVWRDVWRAAHGQPEPDNHVACAVAA